MDAMRGAGMSRRRRGLGALRAAAAAVVLGAGLGLAGVASAAAATPSNGAVHVPDSLWPGHTLASRTFLSSKSGRFHLNMQRDGNLVLYRRGAGAGVVWSTGTGAHWGASAVMQKDGNLVLYWKRKPIWATGTDRPGDAGSHLVVENDGRLNLWSSSGRVIWTSYHSFPSLPELGPGATGWAVSVMQRRLNQLGYWLGANDGQFGDATEQALWALQKAAGVPRTGILDRATYAALAKGVRPAIRPASGTLIEVNLRTDLVMFVRGGKLWATLNTSTGGGYWYTSQGVTSQAITPQGVFHTYSAIDGVDVAPLGVLYRPRFFTGGYAIHGDSSVPPVPVSHGCVRVSNEAIDWIWKANLDPIGTEVWIFS